MKTSTSILLGMGLIAAIAGQPCWAAQDKDAKKPEAAASEAKPGRFAKKLGLTDEQAKALKEARQAHRAAVQPLKEKLRSEMRALREQVREEKGDAEVGASLDRIKGLRSSIQKEREQFQAKLESLLKPTQRAKLLCKASRQARAFGREGKRGGMGRHGRGADSWSD